MVCNSFFCDCFFLEGGRGDNRAVVVDENFIPNFIEIYISIGLVNCKLLAVIKGLFRFWTLLYMAVPWLIAESESIFLPTHLLHVTSCRMASFNSSNVIIQGGIFNSGHGGLNINNGDPEFGMLRDFMSVLIRGSLSTTLWRTSQLETRSFSRSDSRLVRTLSAPKLSPWYPQGCSRDYLGLDP